MEHFTKKTKRMGRPPLPKGLVRSVRLFFRVTPSLYKALQKAAKREQKPLGKWMNDTLQNVIERGD